MVERTTFTVVQNMMTYNTGLYIIDTNDNK